jgi:hypothetical protein
MSSDTNRTASSGNPPLAPQLNETEMRLLVHWLTSTSGIPSDDAFHHFVITLWIQRRAVVDCETFLPLAQSLCQAAHSHWPPVITKEYCRGRLDAATGILVFLAKMAAWERTPWLDQTHPASFFMVGCLAQRAIPEDAPPHAMGDLLTRVAAGDETLFPSDAEHRFETSAVTGLNPAFVMGLGSIRRGEKKIARQVLQVMDQPPIV